MSDNKTWKGPMSEPTSEARNLTDVTIDLTGMNWGIDGQRLVLSFTAVDTQFLLDICADMAPGDPRLGDKLYEAMSTAARTTMVMHTLEQRVR